MAGPTSVSLLDVMGAPQGAKRGGRYPAKHLSVWDYIDAANMSTVPVISDAASAVMAAREAALGNYGAAGLNALGILPLIPALGGLAAMNRMAGPVENLPPLARALKGERGIFAGMNAETADKGLLAKAQQMTKEGASPFDVWQQTGWTDQFPDRKWRFEIDDSGAQWKTNFPDYKQDELQNILLHDAAYQSYPWLRNIDTEVTRGPEKGLWDDSLQKIKAHASERMRAKSVTLHETQHAIQQREGFARGGSPDAISDYLSNEAIQVGKRIGNIRAGIENGDSALLAKLEKRKNDLDQALNFPYEAYRRLAGEAEARLVQKRMNYTPEMRRAVAPWQQMAADVPLDQQIVRFGDGPAMAIEPVYHGSPHKFDKFDLSKIGTGEGAQAYGHGAYLAEAQDVGAHYKVAEENVFPTIRNGDVRLDLPLRESTDMADNKIYSAISQNVKKSSVLDDNVLAQVKKQIQHDADYFAGSPAGAAADAALAKFDEVAARLNGAVLDYDPGYLYETRLRWPDAAREAADPLGPQHFLDWDKPLSEQAAANAITPEAMGLTWKQYEKYGGFVNAQNRPIGPMYRGKDGPMLEADARNKWVADMLLSPTGAELYRRLGLTPAEGSNALSAAGIPGIRYLDGGSRGAGQGTHNYVVFDDSLIEILKRNGVPVEGLLGKAAR